MQQSRKSLLKKYWKQPLPHGRGSVTSVIAASLTAVVLCSCSRNDAAEAHAVRSSAPPAVAVTRVERKPMARYLTMSSELVPFQEIDVFAKEAGFVSKLYVDYGSHVKQGQLIATLEIPELQALLQEDHASITSMEDQVTDAQHELSRIEAQHRVLHLQFERLNSVANSKPGLVAQQEVDDAQGKDLAAESQVAAGKSRLQVAKSQLAVAQSKLAHDQALYDYSKITAPFPGVVTQRYANLGALVQAGTSSNTQATPLVRLSQEDLFRLVIPVPESYVRYVKTGDPVDVRVPALNRTFPGKIARFSIDVGDATRTMRTEVDVPNPQGILIPGVYAEATLALDHKGDALVVPLQAINQDGEHASVLRVDQNDKIQSCQVVLGIQNANYAEVISGVAEGDQVVISDRSGLRPGESVYPKATEAATYQARAD